jgi:hypothetical protein
LARAHAEGRDRVRRSSRNGTALQGALEQALFNPQPVGDIAGGVGSAYGLFLDRHETLYVSNWGNDKVTVYPVVRRSPRLRMPKS